MSIGYVDEHGKYRQGKRAATVEANSSQYKAYSHDRQRAEHLADLIQPYDRNGRPNRRFMEMYDEESKINGMKWEDGVE